MRFKIEQDHTYAPVPAIHLDGLEPVKQPPNNKLRIISSEERGFFRLREKIYSKGIITPTPATVLYKLKPEYSRFVALVGIDDRDRGGGSASFEVYADAEKLFESPSLNKETPPVEINVPIPPRSKRLKLVTKGARGRRRSQCGWLNAGFLRKDKPPAVSSVSVFPVGYDPSQLEAIIVNQKGAILPSRILWAQNGKPMDILFNSASGASVYYVYLVNKDNYQAPSWPWEPAAGLILETRQADKIDPKSHKLSGLIQAWYDEAEPVGRSMVDNVHHGAPIHRLLPFTCDAPDEQDALAMYYYTGFFRINQAGKYTFATASSWGSYVFVDGNLVVSWAGKHRVHGGLRGQQQGQIFLKPGVHKLEYLNGTVQGTMITLAAWQKPNEKLRVMTRGDFLPRGRYVATHVDLRKAPKGYAGFTWHITDDLRSQPEDCPLVAMQFAVCKPPRPGDYRYQWRFDDRTTAMGESVEKIFFRPGLWQVTLEVLKDKEVVWKVSQEVQVHAVWDKINVGLGNIASFDEAISRQNFRRIATNDLISLYGMAARANRPQWQQKAADVLSQRVDELAAELDTIDFALMMGEELCAPAVRRYDQALQLFTDLAEVLPAKTLARAQALLGRAELLLRCYGKPHQAAEILKNLEKAAWQDAETMRRIKLVQAEVLLALDNQEKAQELLISLREHPDQNNEAQVELKHLSMLCHGRLLAECKDDPLQLNYAMEKIETIIAEDPAKLFWGDLNMVKLDIHLARGEFALALHLAERVGQLNLPEEHRPALLGRQVEALCGLEDLAGAQAIYESLSKSYPYSSAIGPAKDAILGAAASAAKN